MLRDPAGWRAIAYFVIKIVLAPLTFSVAVGFYAYGLGALTYSLWRPFLPEVMASDGSLHRGRSAVAGLLHRRLGQHDVLALVGAGVLWCAPRVVAFLTTIDRVLITSLLCATETVDPGRVHDGRMRANA